MRYQQIQPIETGRLEPGDHVTEINPDLIFPIEYGDFDALEWITVEDVWRKEDTVTLLCRLQDSNRPPEPIETQAWQTVLVGRGPDA